MPGLSSTIVFNSVIEQPLNLSTQMPAKDWPLRAPTTSTPRFGIAILDDASFALDLSRFGFETPKKDDACAVASFAGFVLDGPADCNEETSWDEVAACAGGRHASGQVPDAAGFRR